MDSSKTVTIEEAMKRYNNPLIRVDGDTFRISGRYRHMEVDVPLKEYEEFGSPEEFYLRDFVESFPYAEKGPPKNRLPVHE